MTPDEDDYIDDQELRIASVFNTKEVPEVNKETLKIYQQYLLDNLDNKVVCVGTEDFPWEERYVIGGYDQQEYEKLKKTQLSYTDECQLINILLDDDYTDNDLIATVKRLSDGKQFKIELSWLEVVDAECKSHEILSDFSVWAVNW